MEVVQILQQKAIQSFMTGYSFTIVAQILVFLIYVPSVLDGGEQSLSAYFIVLSLIQILRVNAIILVLRCFITTTDTYTSVQRIQVLFLPPPFLSPSLPLSPSSPFLPPFPSFSLLPLLYW